ncbi:MAG: hypothetical protein H6618_06075 [Deltaproteobacteria bacterium]|nr:hypothetical protein [Deltaproteobacteria bacterium]
MTQKSKQAKIFCFFIIFSALTSSAIRANPDHSPYGTNEEDPVILSIQIPEPTTVQEDPKKIVVRFYACPTCSTGIPLCRSEEGKAVRALPCSEENPCVLCTDPESVINPDAKDQDATCWIKQCFTDSEARKELLITQCAWLCPAFTIATVVIGGVYVGVF